MSVGTWLSFSRDHVVTRFRRHPDVPQFWLYREDWPLRGVWEIAGNTGLVSDDAFSPERPMLTTHPADIALCADGPLPALPLMYAWIVANRRDWLKRHARRVPKELWHRATPLPEATHAW